MVRLQPGPSFMEEISKLMNKNKISQAALAAEMGITPSQVTRWFTKNPERRISPSMKSAGAIETALAKLIARRNRI